LSNPHKKVDQLHTHNQTKKGSQNDSGETTMQIFLDDDKIISNKGFISFKNGKIKKYKLN
jgi:hypothetical protein